MTRRDRVPFTLLVVYAVALIAAWRWTVLDTRLTARLNEPNAETCSADATPNRVRVCP